MRKIIIVCGGMLFLLVVAAGVSGTMKDVEKAKQQEPVKIGNYNVEIDPRASCFGREGAFGTDNGKIYTCKLGNWELKK